LVFENLNNGNLGRGQISSLTDFAKFVGDLQQGARLCITNLFGGFLCLMDRFTIEVKVALCHKFVGLKFRFVEHISNLLGKLQFHKMNLPLEVGLNFIE